MEKILVSGCLVGLKVRYHGGDALCDSPILSQWQKDGRIVSICPEVSAGLPSPRPSCEIVGGTGLEVLNRKARVVSHTGIDRTEAFIAGAQNALKLAKQFNIKLAILKKNSPSCGNTTIYDGSYTGQIKVGAGVTAQLLQENGIRVFNESELSEAADYLKQIENKTLA